MGIVNNLKKELDKVLSNAEGSSEKIHKDYAKLTINAKISNHSKVGTELGTAVNGMMPLTIAVDDVNPKVAGSVPSVVISNNVPIVQVTEDLKAVGSSLKTSLSSSDKTLIESMTGLAVVDEMNHVIISAGLPQAVAAAAKQVLPNTVVSDLKEVVNDLSNLSGLKTVLSDIENTALVKDLTDTKLFDDILSERLDDLAGAAILVAAGGPALGAVIGADLINTISKDASSILGKFTKGFDSLVENVVEGITLSATSTILSLAPSINQTKIKEVIEQIAAGNIDRAVSIISKANPNLNKEDARRLLSTIDSKGSTAIAKSNPSTGVTEKIRNIQTVDNLYRGVDSPPEYWTQGLIPNNQVAAELRSVFSTTKREITTIVIMVSNTGTNIKLDGKDFANLMQNYYAYDGPVAHYFISNDNFVSKVIPLELPATKTIETDGWEETSIFVAIQGGIDGPEPTKESRNAATPYGVKSITASQYSALNSILQAAYSVWPGVQVVGYSEIGSTLFGPHFNVQDYVKSKFNKNRTIDLSEPPTRTDLVAHGKVSQAEEGEDLNNNKTSTIPDDAYAQFAKDEKVIDDINSGRIGNGSIVDYNNSKYRVDMPTGNPDDGYELIPLYS